MKALSDDTISEIELKFLVKGGNKNFKDFMQFYNLNLEDIPQKYNSNAAIFYRKYVIFSSSTTLLKIEKLMKLHLLMKKEEELF